MASPSPTGPEPAHAQGLRAFNALVVVIAVVAIVVGFYEWHVYGGPAWQPVSVLGLIGVPLLVRYSFTVTGGGYVNVLGLPAAVLFASGFDSPSHIFPVWALIVVASYMASMGGAVRGAVRAADEVVAGWCLVSVARVVDLGFRPFDRNAVGLAVFVGVLALIFWVRRQLTGSGPPVWVLDRRTTLTALLALYYTSVLIAAMRLTYEEPSDSHTAEVAVLGIGLVLAALIGYTATQQLARGVDVLSEAASSLPWPADDNDRLARRFALEAIRGSRAEIESGAGGAGTVSAPVDAVRHLVLSRERGDRGFTASDRRILDALGTMAGISRAVDLREAGLRLRTITDSLTGLWTYPMFVDLANQAFLERADGQPLALLFFDLDGFKRVNEELGHFDADQVIREIAFRLQDESPSTAITARVAGDEFTILLRDVRPERLEYDVRALVEAVTMPIGVAGQQVTVHVSVGVGLVESPTDTVDDVMRTAEENMRAAKQVGRAAMTTRDEAELVRDVLGGDLMSVAFQPVLDARSAALWGCEALVRINDPELGEVSPLTLLSSAAREQALDALTQRVGTMAMDAMGELAGRVAGPVHVTLNLEFEQFRVDNPIFDDLIALAQRSAGGPTLVLELSERSYRRWTDQQDVLARRLRSHGIKLAIDDFGAGYATFSLLRKWNWDLVKIDRSLTASDDEQSRRLFASVVRTLRELRMTAVAVGVETPEQLLAARTAGVSLVQGHLVSEAVGMEELLRRVGPDGGGLAVNLTRAAV
jgi:diguanylate cyclase (GGDEF)-like protein